MDKQKIADLEASAAEARKKANENPSDESLKTVAETAESELSKAKAPSHNPVKDELDKVQKKQRSPLEKALFSRKKINEQIAELGGDTEDDFEEDDDEDAPVTVGMLKKIERGKAQKNALALAEEIEDLHERELVKHHLTSTIKSSGNPNDDLKIARTIVNSVKNTQIAEEIGRKSQGKTHSSGSGSPARHEEVFEPTPEEAAMMKGFPLLTKEDIIKARPKA